MDLFCCILRFLAGRMAVSKFRVRGLSQEQQGDRAMRQYAWKAYVTSGLLSASLLLGANSAVGDPAAIVKLPQDITFKGSAGGVQLPSSMGIRRSLAFTSCD
jgi:hypothetical protein